MMPLFLVKRHMAARGSLQAEKVRARKRFMALCVNLE